MFSSIPSNLFKNFSDEDIIWLMDNVATNQEIGDDLPEGTIRARYGGLMNKSIENIMWG